MGIIDMDMTMEWCYKQMRMSTARVVRFGWFYNIKHQFLGLVLVDQTISNSKTKDQNLFQFCAKSCLELTGKVIVINIGYF